MEWRAGEKAGTAFELLGNEMQTTGTGSVKKSRRDSVKQKIFGTDGKQITVRFCLEGSRGVPLQVFFTE